ncbi:hypothetical protein LCGC14_2914230, partial [marine sediment metagenome]
MNDDPSMKPRRNPRTRLTFSSITTV